MYVPTLALGFPCKGVPITCSFTQRSTLGAVRGEFFVAFRL